MKAAEAAKIIAVLKAAYPRQEIGTDTIRIYCDMLADLDFASCLAVVKKLLATSRFFPTIAEIRELYAEATLRLPAGDEAWAEVRRGIGKWGRDGSPVWSSPIIEQIVDAIGWRNLCGSEHLASERHRFLQFYGQARSRRIVDAAEFQEADGGQLEGGVAQVVALVTDGKKAP